MGNSLLTTRSDADVSAVFDKFSRAESGVSCVKADDLSTALSELFGVYLSRRQCAALLGKRAFLRRDGFVDCAARFEACLPARDAIDQPGVRFVCFGQTAPVGIALGAHARTGLPVVKGVTGVAQEVRGVAGRRRALGDVQMKRATARQVFPPTSVGGTVRAGPVVHIVSSPPSFRAPCLSD